MGWIEVILDLGNVGQITC